MPHHQIDPDVISDQEKRVAECEKVLNQIEAIKRGGKEGIDELIAHLQELEHTEMVNQQAYLMNAMKLPVDYAYAKAAAHMNAQMAYQNILTLLMAPEKYADHVKSQKKEAELLIERAKRNERLRSTV